jgi:hypothetical protein
VVRGGSAAGADSTDSMLCSAAFSPPSGAQAGHRHASSPQWPDACHTIGSTSSSHGGCAGGVSGVSPTAVAASQGSSAERLSLAWADLDIMEAIAARLVSRTSP